RIGDSIRYSSDAANAAGLAQTDDATLVARFGDFQVNDDFADIADAGELVKLHVGVQYPADLLIHDALFHQRAADAHDAGAVELARGGFGIHHQAAVVHRYHAVHFHDAGLDVHGNIGHLNTGNAAGSQAFLLRFRGDVLAHLRNAVDAELLAGLLPAHALVG